MGSEIALMRSANKVSSYIEKYIKLAGANKRKKYWAYSIRCIRSFRIGCSPPARSCIRISAISPRTDPQFLDIPMNFFYGIVNQTNISLLCMRPIRMISVNVSIMYTNTWHLPYPKNTRITARYFTTELKIERRIYLSPRRESNL